MGQRHQIIILFRRKDGGESETKASFVVFHHQWLYGRKAVSLAIQYIEVMKRFYFGYHYSITEEDIHDITKACYSLDRESGEYHKVFDITDNLHYDNNNGVTVFDFTDEKNLKYCFACIHGGTECLYGKHPLVGIPLDATAWLDAHYPEDGDWGAQCIFRSVSDEEQAHREIRDKCVQLATKLAPYQVLSQRELLTAFSLAGLHPLAEVLSKRYSVPLDVEEPGESKSVVEASIASAVVEPGEADAEETQATETSAPQAKKRKRAGSRAR